LLVWFAQAANHAEIMGTMLQRHADSYIRFSRREQAKGDTFRRQITRMLLSSWRVL
jgi:hypothetical protein